MRIGFIGGGNMAQALICGLAARHRDTSFVVVEPAAATRAVVARLASAATLHETPQPDLASCDAVVLAVKPQVLRDAATAAARCLVAANGARPLVVSIAAGVRLDALRRWLDDAPGIHPLVRAMPNTPALIGAGITALCAAASTDAQARALAETLLAAVGETLWVEDEATLDAVTAVSGSGPAYVFAFIEALQRGAVALGLPADDARRLAIATFAGASRLAAESDEPVATLRERVTSKGGTTAAALTHLEDRGVADAIVDAVRKASARSKELGDALGGD